jgi:putative phage-type endonuclease
MPDDGRTQFHAERLQGLGGSDLAVILGLNPWKTPFSLWQEKTQRLEPIDETLPMKFGSYVEEFVAREYAERTGQRVQRFNAMLSHPKAPLIGHVDRLVIPDGQKVASYKREIRTDKGLECKTASAFAAGRDSEWGPSGTDQVLPHYLIQSSAYMALTGCAHWDLAVLIGNHDFRIYHLHRDPELESYLLEEADRWWRDYVIADTPPPPSSELEARQRWPGHTPGKVVDLDEAQAELIRDYAALKRQAKSQEAWEKILRDQLFPVLADADEIRINGQAVATYRANKASDKTDWKALADELLRGFDPEDRARYLADYTTTVPGPRVLRLGKALEA